jgi:hypothetical protein
MTSIKEVLGGTQRKNGFAAYLSSRSASLPSPCGLCVWNYGVDPVNSHSLIPNTEGAGENPVDAESNRAQDNRIEPKVYFDSESESELESLSFSASLSSLCELCVQNDDLFFTH